MMNPDTGGPISSACTDIGSPEDGKGLRASRVDQ